MKALYFSRPLCRPLWRVLAFGAALLCGQMAVHAQTPPSFLPVRVKLGVLTPQDGTTRSYAGTPLFLAEGDLDLPATGKGKSRLSVGYQTRSGNRSTLRVVPVTYSRIWYAPNPASSLTGNLYYGAGAGLYFLRASGKSGADSKTTLGGYGVAGYDLPGKFFIEGKYHLVTGSVKGLYPNGFALMLGRRL